MELKDDKIKILYSAKEYIPKLQDGLHSISRDIYSGKEHNALKLIPYAFEGFEWLLNTMTLTFDIHGTAIDMEKFNKFLNEMVNAFESEEYLLVADIIEYELSNEIEVWNNVIRKVLSS